MAQGERKLNVRYTFDFSTIQNDADKVKRILAGTYDGLRDDKGVFEAIKGKMEKLRASFSSSGDKMKRPFEEMDKAAKATSVTLDRLTQDNDRAIAKLMDLSAAIKSNINAKGGTTDAKTQENLQQIEKEINARNKLRNQLNQQGAELEALTAKIQQHTPAEKSLTQQLSETRQRMQDLAAAGKANSQEYDELKSKAQTLSNAMKQVASDSAVQQQVRFRTALMNTKQQMMELEQAGKRDTEQYRLLRAEAERLQRTMYETNTQMRILATPNTKMSATINLMTGMSGALSATTGAIALFGEENEKAVKIQAKLNSIMAITMGLQSINQTLNKNSAFQVGIVGQMTEWWARCKAKAAAATTADTAAITANTAATTAATAATSAGAAVTEAATAANTAHAFSWKAVGIAIKSVPIWGWIIAGLTALVGIIVAVTGGLNKLTEGQKAMREAMKKAYPEIQKERSELDALYRTATIATKPINERRIAIQKLQAQYPEYFQNLKQEAILAGEAAEAYDRLKKAIEQKAIAKSMEAIKEKAYEEISKWISSNFTQKQWIEDNRAKAEELQKKYTPAQVQSLVNHSVTMTQGNFMYQPTQEEEEANFLYKWQHSLKDYEERYKKENKKSLEKIESAQKFIDDAAEALPKTIEEQRNAWGGDSTQGYKADPQYYKRMMEQALKDADDYVPRDLGGGVKETPGDISRRQMQARKEYYKYKNLYDQARFDPKDRSSQIGASDLADQKLNDLQSQQELERMKLRIQMRREYEEQEVAIMAEGAEKRRRQRELEEQSEMDALQDRMNQEIQAEVARQQALWNAQEDARAKEASAGGRTYQKRAWDGGELRSHIWGIGYDIDRETTNTGMADMGEIDAITQRYAGLQELLLKLQAKRAAEQEKADKSAMDEYVMEYGAMAEKIEAIDRQYREKISKAENDGSRMQLQQEWRKAIEDAEFEEWMQGRGSLAFGEADALTQETIGQLIEEMERYREKIIETLDPEKIERFNTALGNLRRAKIEGSGALSALTPEYMRERKAAQEELNDAQETSNRLAETQAKKQEAVRKKIAEIQAAVKQLTGLELTEAEVLDGATVEGAIDAIAGSGAEEEAEGLRVLNEELGTARTELDGAREAADKARSALERLAEAFKAKFESWADPLEKALGVFEEIGEALAGVNQVFEDIRNTASALGADTGIGSGWDTAGNILSGLTGITSGISDALKSALTLNIGGVLSGVTSALTSPINAVVAIHDNKRERAIQRIQDEVEELERINKRLDRALEGQYSQEAASTYEEKIANAEEQIALIEEQIRQEEDKKNTDDDRIQEWRDQIEELENDIEDYKDAALDAIIGEDVATSIENFAEAMADAWGSTREQAKSAKDYVKSMLKQMVVEAMKTDLTAPIERLREMMQSAISDGKVTEAESQAMQDYAEAIAEMITGQYAWADDILKDETSSQSGTTRGGYATASQESVEELSGRMAAVHTSVEGIRIAQAAMAIDVTAVRSGIELSAAMASETRGLTMAAVGHLETIAKNTNRLHEISEWIEKIEQHTRGL